VCDTDFEKLKREISELDPRAVSAACAVVAHHYKESDLQGSLDKDTDTPHSYKTLLLYARAEVHALLCTKDRKYTKERKAAAIVQSSVIGYIAGAVTVKFGVAPGVASAAAVACLVLPVKMGVQAWCSFYRDTQLSRQEQIVLRKVAADDEVA